MGILQYDFCGFISCRILKIFIGESGTVSGEVFFSIERMFLQFHIQSKEVRRISTSFNRNNSVISFPFTNGKLENFHSRMEKLSRICSGS